MLAWRSGRRIIDQWLALIPQQFISVHLKGNSQCSRVKCTTCRWRPPTFQCWSALFGMTRLRPSLQEWSEAFSNERGQPTDLHRCPWIS